MYLKPSIRTKYGVTDVRTINVEVINEIMNIFPATNIILKTLVYILRLLSMI